MNMPAMKHSQIHQGFYNFVNEQLLINTTINMTTFWQTLEHIIEDFSGTSNNTLQSGPIAIDTIQQQNTVTSAPIDNKTAIIDALNKRWESANEMEINTASLLDDRCPLANGSHADVKNYVVYYHHLLAFFEDGSQAGLKNPSQFVALCGHKCAPDSILLKEGGRHIEIIIDKSSKTGRDNKAGIQDTRIETNACTILDFASHQDASAERQIEAYRTYMQTIDKSLRASGQLTSLKRPNLDHTFTGVNGEDYMVKGTTALYISNTEQTGELMQTAEGNFAPQDLVDTVILALISKAKGEESLAIIQASSKKASDIVSTNLLHRRIEKMLNMQINTLAMVVT